MSAFKSGLVSTQHFWPAARSVSLKTKQIKTNRFQRRSKSVTQLRKLLSPFWTPSMSGITALRKWASAGFRRRAEREGIITTAIAAATCNPPLSPLFSLPPPGNLREMAVLAVRCGNGEHNMAACPKCARASRAGNPGRHATSAAELPLHLPPPHTTPSHYPPRHLTSRVRGLP